MPPAPPVAVLLHGAGSTPDAARRLLGDAAPGWTLVAPEARGTLDDVVATLAASVARIEASGRTVGLVGGISLGAHAVARWATEQPGGTPDLVLAMPAWTGRPDGIAALTAATADEIERDGTAALLARVVAESGDDWVAYELVRAWEHADRHELARTLRAAATSAAPTLDELATIRARAVVVALLDDPLHPEQVARDWAAAIPGARLVPLPRNPRARGELGGVAGAVLRRLVPRVPPD